MAAGNAVIGALRVVLGADTAALETGLKSAAAKLGVFAGVGIAAGEAFARGLGDALKGLANVIPKTINDFDNLSKTSQKIGVPVEQLAALQHAAQLSDVSSESLTKGLAKLARSAVDAAQGSTTAVAAYQALGVSFRDSAGQIKPVGDLLPDIADKFASMKDGSAKTALAMQIFGKAGADLIPLLNGGSASLNDMTAEAKALGLVISGDTAVTAENFNDNLTRLGGVIRGVVVQVTANILPALAQFSQYLIDTAKNSGFLQSATNVLTTAFNGFARAAIIVYDNLDLLKQAATYFIYFKIAETALNTGMAFVQMARAIRAAGLVMGAFELIRKAGTKGLLLTVGVLAIGAGVADKFSDAIKSVTDAVASMLPEDGGKVITDLLEKMGVNLKGLTADLTNFKGVGGKGMSEVFNPNIVKTTKDQLESYIASQNKHIAASQAQAATVGQSVFEQTRLKTVQEGLAIAAANNIKPTADMQRRLQELGVAAGEAALRLQGQQLIMNTMMPWDQRALTVQQYTAALMAAGASTETIAQVSASVKFPDFYRASVDAQDFGANLDRLATSSVNGLSSTLAGVITGAKKAGEAFKQFAASVVSDIAAMIAKALIWKALKVALGFPFADGGPVGDPTKIGGLYAGGGRVSGPGGPTSDSIPARLSNGEFVVNAKAVRGNLALLEAINAGAFQAKDMRTLAVPKFADGGLVDARAMASSPVGSASSAAPTRELVVRGLGVRDMFTGQSIRDLIDLFNDAISDGSRLKIVAA